MAVLSCPIDAADGEVAFVARHMVVTKVRGRFTRWHGTIQLDEADLARSSVEVHVDVASVDTQAKDRDDYVRSAELFDAARYPEMVFRSRRIEPAGRDRFHLIGDLTIRNLTRQLGLEARVVERRRLPNGSEQFRFTATSTLSRAEWGLTFGKTLDAGGVLVGDKIEIAVAVEFAAQPRAS
jgi:polyisoprenoid-binding protein YceI